MYGPPVNTTSDVSTTVRLASGLLAMLILFAVFRVIYNVYLHPLSKIPGPPTWSAFRLPFVLSLLRGTIVHDIQDLHRRYGPVLRIAPNEVTFAQPEAWKDIFQYRPGHAEFLKDAIWWRGPPGKPDSLLSAIHPEEHARIRKALAPAFTTRALRSQEVIVHRYVNLLVERLSEITDSSANHEAEVDILPWLNFTTFDVFGDLGFGESFDCLEQSKYHPWIALLFNSVKAASFISAARYYPVIEKLLFKMIPASLRKMADDHYRQIVDKVDRRLNWEVQRSDIMSPVIDGMHKSGGLSKDEINATFSPLTTAGSETTATALAGTLNYLVQNPDKLGKLAEEVRQKFQNRSGITLDAVQDLPYLNAVLNEGLRLCPPVPWMLPRIVPQDGDTVCGIWLPGGTPVSIQAYSLNRDPAYFHLPERFLPERWLPDRTDPESIFRNDRCDDLHPFSAGSRSCIGRHLAWAEMRLIMAKLIWTFDFKSIESKTLKWESLKTFLLVEKKPIYVKMAQRKVSQDENE
ncbi:Cytochrome P450 monooxygenase lcsI [Paramyrothecium foliicola]|nr:Cytochrome P450 monooxygenase lcsI [Paramyrothecium foliicola]